MTIDIKPELEALIRQDVERGACPSIDEFVERAIRMLHDEEQLLLANKDAIHEKIGHGLAQLDRGQGISAEASRPRLQSQKAAWLDQQRSS